MYDYGDSDSYDSRIESLEEFTVRKIAEHVAAIHYGDDEDRVEACAELRAMGAAAAEAIQPLLRLLVRPPDDESGLDQFVRGMACDALGAIGDAAREALPMLHQYATDPSLASDEGRWTKLRAAAAIFKITGDDTIAKALLEELEHAPEEWLRHHAEKCLSMLSGGDPWPDRKEGRLYLLLPSDDDDS